MDSTAILEFLKTLPRNSRLEFELSVGYGEDDLRINIWTRTHTKTHKVSQIISQAVLRSRDGNVYFNVTLDQMRIQLNELIEENG